jgi:hypothetical protein
MPDPWRSKQRTLLGGMGNGRCARLLRIDPDHADVARDRRLVLLVYGDRVGKDQATAKETQIQSFVEGEPALEELVGGHCQRASPKEDPPH